MATTDKGPNEQWHKKAVTVMTKEIDNFFYFPSPCYEHLVHLGVLSGLKLCDDILKRSGRSSIFKYFSSVAMICNTLRDIGQDVFASWRHPLPGSFSGRSSRILIVV